MFERPALRARVRGHKRQPPAYPIERQTARIVQENRRIGRFPNATDRLLEDSGETSGARIQRVVLKPARVPQVSDIDRQSLIAEQGKPDEVWRRPFDQGGYVVDGKSALDRIEKDMVRFEIDSQLFDQRFQESPRLHEQAVADEKQP